METHWNFGPLRARGTCHAMSLGEFASFWPGHLPDQRGGLVTSEGMSLTGRSSVPETHGFQFFRNWKKVGESISVLGKSPRDSACFFLGGGKTKKKTLAVSLPPFFCDFHISEKSVLLGDQLSYEMRGRCILRIKWLCGSAFLSTDG